MGTFYAKMVKKYPFLGIFFIIFFQKNLQKVIH